MTAASRLNLTDLLFLLVHIEPSFCAVKSTSLTIRYDVTIFTSR